MNRTDFKNVDKAFINGFCQFKEGLMKKIFIMLILTLSVIGFMSCNKQDSVKQNEEVQVADEAKAQVEKEMTEVKDMLVKRNESQDPKERENITNEIARKLSIILSKDENNMEANNMMNDVQLDIVETWLTRGKYSRAKEMIDNVLQFAPDNQRAKDIKAKAEDWELMTKEEFMKLKNGMYMDEVTQLVGYPVKKEENVDRYKRKIYGWFYKEPKDFKAVQVWFNENGQVYSLKWPK